MITVETFLMSSPREARSVASRWVDVPERKLSTAEIRLRVRHQWSVSVERGRWRVVIEVGLGECILT